MNRRLDSWKAIAEYLGRDAATARRWEKTLGLPVKRVAGGAGRSVFAYTDDIDAWLASSCGATTQPLAAPAPPVSAPPTPLSIPEPPPAIRRAAAPRAVAAAALAVTLLGTAWWATSSRAATAPLRVTVDEHRIAAADERGVERWHRDFPANTQTVLPSFTNPVRVVGGDSQTIYVGTSYRSQLPEGPIEGGELAAFDASGERRHVFSFGDEIRMRGTTFGAPWALTDFAVAEADGNEAIAVAAHHYMWSPSVVTVLDREWRRRGTWTHDGWIESLKWVEPRRLVAAGFDQERNGGFAALLDAETMTPLRMVVMPRSEINVVTASRFNRAILQPVNGRIIARTVEMSDEVSQGAIDVIYEFTRSLDLVNVSFSGRYWEMHRSLELQGKLRHSQSECPDRRRPREVAVWEPSTGWRTRAVSAP